MAGAAGALLAGAGAGLAGAVVAGTALGVTGASGAAAVGGWTVGATVGLPLCASGDAGDDEEDYGEGPEVRAHEADDGEDASPPVRSLRGLVARSWPNSRPTGKKVHPKIRAMTASPSFFASPFGSGVGLVFREGKALSLVLDMV